MNEAVDTSDIFLSYARSDKDFAEKMVSYLQKQGFTVFWDPDIVCGENWTQFLEDYLRNVKCVIVLWSKNSVSSLYVRWEADVGLTRRVLAPVRIDKTELPIGFKFLHTIDLIDWQGQRPPAQISKLLSRVRALKNEPSAREDRAVQSRELSKELLLGEKSVRTEHYSVSNHELDKQAILNQLPDISDETRTFILNGYSELDAAQIAARERLDDQASFIHYASAADYFQLAIDALGTAVDRIARSNQPIKYFLTMELANSLSLSEPTPGTKHEDAITIYKTLSQDARWANDAAVYFRLAWALARASKLEEEIHDAIRNLRKAQFILLDNPDIPLEGNWLYFEIPRQLGILNFKLSQLPGISKRKRLELLDGAISNTRLVLEQNFSQDEEDAFLKFTVLKSRSNLIFLLAKKIRANAGDKKDKATISRIIEELQSGEYKHLSENQVHIIDSIAFSAASIGKWDLAKSEAQKNIENFRSIAVNRHLVAEEMEMLGRAEEIFFFCDKMIQGRKFLSRWTR